MADPVLRYINVPRSEPPPTTMGTVEESGISMRADGRRHADHRRRVRLLRGAARLAAMEGKVDTPAMRRLRDFPRRRANSISRTTCAHSPAWSTACRRMRRALHERGYGIWGLTNFSNAAHHAGAQRIPGHASAPRQGRVVRGVLCETGLRIYEIAMDQSGTLPS